MLQLRVYKRHETVASVGHELELVSALAVIGERQRARGLMARLLRQASPLGLVV